MALTKTLELGSSTSHTLTYTEPVLSTFVATKDTGSEVILKSTEVPLDVTNSYRFARQRIANIYNGKGIHPNYQLPTKTGINLLLQSWQVLQIADPADAKFRALVPFGVRLVLEYPLLDLFEAQYLGLTTKRLLGFAFEAGAASSTGFTRLTSLMAGAINPLLWPASSNS